MPIQETEKLEITTKDGLNCNTVAMTVPEKFYCTRVDLLGSKIGNPIPKEHQISTGGIPANEVRIPGVAVPRSAFTYYPVVDMTCTLNENIEEGVARQRSIVCKPRSEPASMMSPRHRR